MRIDLFPAIKIFIKHGTGLPLEDQQNTSYGRLSGNQLAMHDYDRAKRDFERYQQEGHYAKPKGQISNEALQARNSWNAAQRMRTGESQYDPSLFGVSPAPDMSNYQGPSYWDMYADQWRRVGNVPHYIGLTNQEAFPLQYRDNPYLNAGAALSGGGLAAILGGAGLALSAAAPSIFAVAAPAAATAAGVASTPGGQQALNRAANVLPAATNWMANMAMRAGPAMQGFLNSPLGRNRDTTLNTLSRDAVNRASQIGPAIQNAIQNPGTTVANVARSGLYNMGTIARDFSFPGVSFYGHATGKVPFSNLSSLLWPTLSSSFAAQNMYNAYNQAQAQSELTGSNLQGLNQGVKSWASGIPISPLPAPVYLVGTGLNYINNKFSPSPLQNTDEGMLIPQNLGASIAQQTQDSYTNSLLLSPNPEDRALGQKEVEERYQSERPIGRLADRISEYFTYDFNRPISNALGLGRHPYDMFKNTVDDAISSYSLNTPDSLYALGVSPTAHMRHTLEDQFGMTPQNAENNAPGALVSGLIRLSDTEKKKAGTGPNRNTPEANVMGTNAQNYTAALNTFAKLINSGEIPFDVFDSTITEFIRYQQSGFNNPIPNYLRFDLMQNNGESAQAQNSTEPKPAGAL